VNRAQLLILVTIIASVVTLDLYNAQIFDVDDQGIIRAVLERGFANQIVTHSLLITIIIILLTRQAVVLKIPDTSEK
jgi:hypothetical protein